VLNGDVLTSLDYAELFEQHRASGSALTVATHPRVVRSEYGVLHVEGDGRLQRVLDYGSTSAATTTTSRPCGTTRRSCRA
jgi:NDP-sugar pyrophosphorylase family protein